MSGSWCTRTCARSTSRSCPPRSRNRSCIGDPFDDATTLGPVNNEPTVAKTERHVRDAVDHGAAVLAGGSRAPSHGSDLFYEATVIDGVTADMAIAREETFGPVAPVSTIRSTEEAIDAVNGSPYGLLDRHLHAGPGPGAALRRGRAGGMGERQRGHELLGVAPAVRRSGRLAERRRARRRTVLHGSSDRAEDRRAQPGLKRMTEETLRSRLAGGGTAFGTMMFEFHTLGIPRIAASAGADFVLIDLEHTGWGVDGIRPLLAAGAARDVALLVRVQGSARHLISPSLDLGARGVMVPMVDDAIEAGRVVQAARFAPDGSRGFGLLYPDQLTDGVGVAMRTAEDATVVILQIETEAGRRARRGDRGDARCRRALGRAVRPFDRAGGAGRVRRRTASTGGGPRARGVRVGGDSGRGPGRIGRGRPLDAHARLPDDRAGLGHRPVRRSPALGAGGPSGHERPALTRGRYMLPTTQRIACHRNTRRPPLREQA